MGFRCWCRSLAPSGGAQLWDLRTSEGGLMGREGAMKDAPTPVEPSDGIPISEERALPPFCWGSTSATSGTSITCALLRLLWSFVVLFLVRHLGRRPVQATAAAWRLTERKEKQLYKQSSCSTISRPPGHFNPEATVASGQQAMHQNSVWRYIMLRVCMGVAGTDIKSDMKSSACVV